jgi:hypothetical protein
MRRPRHDGQKPRRYSGHGPQGRDGGKPAPVFRTWWRRREPADERRTRRKTAAGFPNMVEAPRVELGSESATRKLLRVLVRMLNRESGRLRTNSPTRYQPCVLLISRAEWSEPASSMTPPRKHWQACRFDGSLGLVRPRERGADCSHVSLPEVFTPSREPADTPLPLRHLRRNRFAPVRVT